MAKKRQFNEQEEIFFLNAEKVEVNKIVHVEIQDFTKRIDDKENKKKKIKSPKFKVGDTSLTVSVYPEDWREDSDEYIAVYLNNEEMEKVSTSATFKHASGREVPWKGELPVGDGLGLRNFLSHKAYKEWAKDHGDVFKVEVEITLHDEKSQWTSNR